MTLRWRINATAWCGCAPAASKKKPPDKDATGSAKKNETTPRRAAASSLALRYALREMRSGLRGFYVFIACIALGVMAIAGVGSVAARSPSEGLAREGRTLLGGDAAFSLMQREAKPEELAFLRSRGQVSTAAALRGFGLQGRRRQARTGRDQGGRQCSYPMLGQVTMAPDMPVR